ncbi:AbrB/MazE/SpoVT family DNA-binding domain-containing protein [Pseudomonas asiatica]
MVEIPIEALDAIGVAIGDVVSVEIINGEIVLRPTREADLS